MARSRSTDIPDRYATAWLEAAEERGVLTRVREEIDRFDELLNASAEFADFLQDRAIPPAAKQDILTRLFKGKIEDISLNFLFLLVDKYRERLFADILAACHRLLDERDGILNAEVVSAVELSDDQRAVLQTKLEGLTGKKIRMHASVNPALIAGFVVRVGDTVFDGSLRVQLQRLRRALIGR